VLQVFLKLGPPHIFRPTAVSFQGEEGVDADGLTAEMYSVFFQSVAGLCSARGGGGGGSGGEGQNDAEDGKDGSQGGEGGEGGEGAEGAEGGEAGGAGFAGPPSFLNLDGARAGGVAAAAGACGCRLFETASAGQQDTGVFLPRAGAVMEGGAAAERALEAVGRMLLKCLMDIETLPAVFPPFLFGYLIDPALAVPTGAEGALQALAGFDPQEAAGLRRLLAAPMQPSSLNTVGGLFCPALPRTD
jgi:hypothetical protein